MFAPVMSVRVRQTRKITRSLLFRRGIVSHTVQGIKKEDTAYTDNAVG